MGRLFYNVCVYTRSKKVAVDNVLRSLCSSMSVSFVVRKYIQLSRSRSCSLDADRCCDAVDRWVIENYTGQGSMGMADLQEQRQHHPNDRRNEVSHRLLRPLRWVPPIDIAVCMRLSTGWLEGILLHRMHGNIPACAPVSKEMSSPPPSSSREQSFFKGWWCVTYKNVPAENNRSIPVLHRVLCSSLAWPASMVCATIHVNSAPTGAARLNTSRCARALLVV